MSNVKDKYVPTPDDVLSDVGDRLRLVLDHVGIAEAASLVGKSEKQLRRYVAGAEPPFLVLDALVRTTGVTFDWLASGDARSAVDYQMTIKAAENELRYLNNKARTDMSSEERLEMSELAELNRDIISASRAKVALSERRGNRNADDINGPRQPFIMLPTYPDVRASAGPGATIHSEVTEGVISFDPRFLREQGATPEKCTVIWAHGDSMTPTIPDGSALIVDHSQTEVKNGSIMVINVGEDLLVKRVRRRMDGLIDLISDNAAYQPETLGPDALQQLRVIGRVVYFCRTP